jgi:hypothetical protein
LKTDKNGKYDFFDVFFIGICVVGAILNLWSLLLPTNKFSFFFLLFLSLFCLYLINKQKSLKISSFYLKLKRYKSQTFQLLVILITIIIVLFSSMVTPRLFDSHLYHIGAIQWNEMYNVVPGLGNFHDRFGFNSSFFVMSAAFTFSSFLNQSVYLLSSLVFLIFYLWLIKIAFEKKGIIAFLCVFYMYFFYEQYTLDISSPGSDLLPNILISFLLFKFLILNKNMKNQYLILIIIPIFCVTLKLSMVPFLLFSLMALFYRHNKINAFKYLLLYGIIFILPWIIRNIILTGYLLYPFEGIDFFNFDWKVPVEKVQETKGWVYSWAKIPFYNYKEVLDKSFTDWFVIWWEMKDLKNRRLFSIALISPLLFIFALICNKNKFNKNIVLSYFICYLSFVFWLFQAPDFRFSFSIILILNVFIIMIIFNYKIFQHKYIMHGINIFMISTLLILAEKSFILFSEDYNINIPKTYLFKPIDYKSYVKNCQAKFIKNKYYLKNNKEVILYGIDPINASRCFDAFPCSAYLNENIKLRGNSLNDGFKYEKK